MLKIYKKGELVHSIFPPYQKLVIIRYTDGVYYCKLDEKCTMAEQVYYESEIRIKK